MSLVNLSFHFCRQRRSIFKTITVLSLQVNPKVISYNLVQVVLHTITKIFFQILGISFDPNQDTECPIFVTLHFIIHSSSSFQLNSIVYITVYVSPSLHTSNYIRIISVVLYLLRYLSWPSELITQKSILTSTSIMSSLSANSLVQKMCENIDFTLNFGGINFYEMYPNCLDFKRAQFVAIALPRTARALKHDKSQKCKHNHNYSA